MYTEIPAADLLSAGRFDERPGMTVYREHGARNWMISLTVSGSAEFRVADEQVFTECGDLVLIAPGVTHHYRACSEGPWACWWAHFQPRAAWFSWWRLPELAPGFSLTQFGSGRVRQAEAAFERVHRNAAQSSLDVSQGRMVSRGRGGIFATELALNAIEELLLLAAVKHELRQARQPDPRAQQVLDVISADLAAPLTVDGLARLVALSPSRLAHVFRREIGDSIINVVLAMRLRKAASLLEFTDRAVGQIATDVGFSSPYYFSRQFRNRFGITPSDYRIASRAISPAG
jgi:AraC family transcriptional regulator of arabinose operon